MAQDEAYWMRPQRDGCQETKTDPGSGQRHSATQLARHALVAIAFRHFLERKRYPELVANCIFQLWHSQLVWARWADDGGTDISKKDAEGRPRMVPTSCASAASFACIEQLGVAPPPSDGWVPRESDEPAAAETDETSPEWWGNLANSEWIYHSPQDMYFHMPTNTLWERREVECCDPDACASPHTYCRADAFHLQALSMFAQSINSAILPMAWKAWVRYTRKRAGRHTNKPPGSPDMSFQSRKQPGVPLVKNAEVKDVPAAANAKAEDTSETGPLQLESVSPPHDIAGSEEGNVGSAADVSSKPLAAPCTVAFLPAASGIAATDGGSSDEGQRQRRCFCLCRRHRRNVAKNRPNAAVEFPTNTDGVTPAPAVAESRGGPTMSQAPAAESERDAATSAREAVNTARDSSTSSKNPLDTADLHSQRLERFLEAVRQNPQRLSTHVERRRAEKTYLAFIV